MAKAKAKKRADAENELMTHVDLISDPKIKQYIMQKKTAKLEAKRKRQGVWKKDVEMESESSEEEAVKAPVLAKIKAKTKAQTVKKVTKSKISK